MHIAYLKPRSGFPERLPSADTLFGGLAWGLTHIYGRDYTDKTMGLFASRNPPFLISSLMPYIATEGSKIRLYPTPVRLSAAESDDKRMRKAEWCSEEAMKLLVKKGARTFDGLRCEQGILLSENEKATLPKDILSESAVERTAVNRMAGGSADGQLFFDKNMRFGKTTGLYFLIDFRDASYEQAIKSTLNFLADDGIGPNASTGSGSFQAAGIEKLEAPWGTTGSHFMALSPYRPDDAETKHIMAGDSCWYHLGRKKTSIKSIHSTHSEKPVWKKSFSFFREGSVLPKAHDGVHGTFPLLAHKGENLSHNVYAYLYAFPLWMEAGQ